MAGVIEEHVKCHGWGDENRVYHGGLDDIEGSDVHEPGEREYT
jgi:hypothetical protein